MEEINKPYPSWTWVTNEVGVSYWDAPKPMPREHRKIFAWSEDEQEWTEVR